MARIVLLGPAHDVAGVREDVIDAPTIEDVLNEAVARYGAPFKVLLGSSQVWLNGEPVDLSTRVEDYDEIAVLPPVSGG